MYELPIFPTASELYELMIIYLLIDKLNSRILYGLTIFLSVNRELSKAVRIIDFFSLSIEQTSETVRINDFLFKN